MLVYRLGSLGDTVVALPSLHLIARTFANAERRVLTNFPVSGKAAPLEDVLGESGLVHGYFRYPTGSRNIRELLGLRKAIKEWGPDLLVYLAAPRGRLVAVRDALFFFSCGIPRLLGVPYRRGRQHAKSLEGNTNFEPEAHRLLRAIAAVGIGDCEQRANWNLGLTPAERTSARQLLSGTMNREFIVVSAGTKADTKDWGERNWTEALSLLSLKEPQLGLVLVGSADEIELGERVSLRWKGPKLNLCGRSSPRVTAAVIEHAVLFLGHDSGPMHLSAAVGTPCVAIFSARNRPGEWFPFGTNNTVLYHQTECFGCELVRCLEHNKKCIMSISVEEVLQAVENALGSNRLHDGQTEQEHHTL